MNDHPPSLQPVVTAIAGFFISIAFLGIPILAVTGDRVKLPEERPVIQALNSGEGKTGEPHVK